MERDVAIIGMACVFPKAPDLDAFWRNICDGVDAITDLPAARLDPRFYDPDSSATDRIYTRRGGFIDEFATFDAKSFGIMPNTVQGAEPEQLLALQVASDALADAGYAQRAFSRDKTSVVIGRGNYVVPGQSRLVNRTRGAQQLVDSLRTLLPDLTEAPASPSPNTSANFAWSGSDDLTPPASLLYNRWLSPLQSDTGTFAAGTGAAYSGLTDGTYTFHVIAKDNGGNVSPEATATFTVAVPPGPPPPPSPVAAALVSPRVVRVTWANVAGETRYDIERCLSTRGCSYVLVAGNRPADTTSYDDTISIANPAGPYSYRVRACNLAGCSAWVVAPNVNVQ